MIRKTKCQITWCNKTIKSDMHLPFWICDKHMQELKETK